MSFDEAQAVSKVAGKIGAAGNIYTIGEGFVTSARTRDPMPFVKAGGSVGGGWAGAKAGAALGTYVYPGPGTIIGAVLGGLGGGIIGDKAAEEGGEFIIKKITDN